MSVMLLNAHYDTPKLSKTLMIGQKYKELTEAGRKIANLGIGQSPFPVPDILQQSLARNTHQADYQHIAGLPTLRQNVAKFYKRYLNQPDLTKDDVIVTAGSKMSYYAFFSILKNNFIIPQPSWVSYIDQANSLNHSYTTVKTYQQTDWKLTPHHLISQLTKAELTNAVIIFNNPTNPTGISYTPQELKELANLFKTYNITVLADEVYWLLNNSYDPHYSIAHYLPSQTIFISSVSKYLSAAGWRLGYIILPPTPKYTPLKKALHLFNSNTISSVSAPIQYAVAAAYQNLTQTHSPLRSELQLINNILKRVATKCYKILKSASPHIEISQPTGAYYLFITFPYVNNDTDPAEELLEKHDVLTVSGEVFGAPKNTVRASYLNFDGQKFFNISKTQKPTNNLIDEICEQTFTAFQKIAKYAISNSL